MTRCLRALLVALACLFCSPAFGWQAGSTGTTLVQNGQIDVKQSADFTWTGTHTFNGVLKLPGSTSLPGTCAEGSLYQDTDSGGSELYVCTATNTWTNVLAGPLTGDVTTSGTTATIGANKVTTSMVQSGITLDTEWDTAAEINAATTDDDFLTLAGTQTVTGDKTFSAPITGDLVGNASTATALQNNPTETGCGTGSASFATAIDASGNLTCGQVDVGNATGTLGIGRLNADYGDFTCNGSTCTLDTSPPSTTSITFTVNSAGAGSEPANGAGYKIEGGSGDVTILYDATGNDLEFTGAAGGYTFDGPINVSAADGSRGATFQDNTTEPSAPSSGSTLLYALGGEFYKKDNGDGTNERLILNDANITGDFTCAAPTGGTSTCSIGVDKVTASAIAANAVGTSEIADSSIAQVDIDDSATLAGNPAFGVSSVWFATTGLIWEGATSDSNEGLLVAADVTADRTWTLPDLSGTIALTDAAQTFTAVKTFGTSGDPVFNDNIKAKFGSSSVWSIKSDGTDFVFTRESGSGVFILGSPASNTQTTLTSADTTDGTDDRALYLNGSGKATGNSRAAYIELFGNEVSVVGGQLIMGAGGSAGIAFQTGGSTKLSLSTTNLNLVGSFVLEEDADRSITVNRETSAATAGRALSVGAGGAKSGGTDLAGGNLTLTPGLPTGQGKSYVTLQSYTRATSSGTGDQTAVDRLVVGGKRTLTDASAVAVLNATVASGSMAAGIIHYSIEATNGTDYQVESGQAHYATVNKAGTVTSTVTETAASTQAVSSGTLTTAWTISAANPAVISVNADTSLTPSTGYPRITFWVENLTDQSIALQ